MNRTEQNPEALLDALIEGVRDERLDDRLVEESRRRVWARISAAAAAEEPGTKSQAPSSERALETCEDFQKLFDEYRAGTLSPARRMLVADHLHECVACRKALHPVTVRMTPTKVLEMPKKTVRPMRWATAAAIFLTAGITGYWMWDNIAPSPAGNRMTVVAADGLVYRLKNGALEPVAAGATFGERERLRTAGGGHAIVRLFDGSTMEVGQRAEFAVSAGRRDTTVMLDRGQVIVQAAKRSRGHLYVSSADSRVAVTGTVFSVNRGLKGSRVSVVEGSVEVHHRGREQTLKAGDQVTTDPSMARVAITDEISWSRNFDQYLALLRQFVDLKSKLEQVHIATLRYGSRLLDGVPEGTTVYIAVPNLGRAITDMQRIVRDQAAQSPELREQLGKQLPEFEKVTSRLAQIGEYLGEEIVIPLQPGDNFRGVLMAEVHRPGLREYIEKNLAEDMKGLHFEFTGNRVFIGPRADTVIEAAKGGSRFTQTPFGDTVAQAYRRGAGLLLAVNLEHLISREKTPPAAFSGMGIDSARYLIAEQREINGKNEYSAVVRFNGARHGMAAWLAEPGAVGGLNFISPDAQFAASFVVKDPAQMLKDALAFSQSFSRSSDTLREFENSVGFRLDELAGAMGGEATFALDGPIIPVPAWKVVLEVRDAARVQAAIEKMIATANEKLRQHGNQGLEISSTVQTQRERKGMAPANSVSAAFYRIRLSGTVISELNYTFHDGYLVMGPTEALVARSIEQRRSGVTLARSGDFRRLLPSDTRAHFSGMVYQNAGELIRLMAEGASAAVSPEQQKNAEEIARKIEPMLVVVYGEQDRIEVASQGSALNLLTQSMAGQLFGHEAHRTKRELKSYR